MRYLLLAMPIVLFCAEASANLRPAPWALSPQPNPFIQRPTTPGQGSNATLEITATFSGPPARLKLPRSLVQSLLATPQPRSDAGGISPTRTVMAGLALCAAITMAGLTFARRKSARLGRVALLAIAGTLAFAAVHASADIRPPPGPLGDVRPTLNPAAGSFPLTVELSDGNVVELECPSAPASR